MFVEDNINVKIPLDGPQYRVFTQNYVDPDTGKKYFVQIWKSHHSLMDGMSSMAITASACKNYGPHLFIPFKEISIVNRILLRVFAPFSAIMMLKNVLQSRDRNVLTEGKKRMTGKQNVSMLNTIETAKIKRLSKQLGITINDVVMTCMSTAFHRYFKEHG
jgi:NRPS condensation-like uncharacterized protein